jgi:hypothetical protein
VLGVKQFRWRGSARSLRFTAVLAAVAAAAGVVWGSHQLWMEMQGDSVRALKMISGQRNVGSNRLQVPMLREGSFPKVAVQQRSLAKAADGAVAALDLAALKLKGQPLQLSFAGMLPSSDHDVNNYILFALREKLLGAGAASVKITYPVSTYRVGSDLTSTGFGNELDNVFMLTRDTRLKDAPAAGAGVPVFLRIRQAGVDTYDRSIFTAWFYVWSFGVSLAAVVGVAALCYVLIERRWPEAAAANRAISTVVGLAAGFNLLMWIFYSSTPNLLRYQIVSQVSLSLASLVNGAVLTSEGSASDSVTVGGPQLDAPEPLGGDQIFAPTEGGVYPVIPRAALVP